MEAIGATPAQDIIFPSTTEGGPDTIVASATCLCAECKDPGIGPRRAAATKHKSDEKKAAAKAATAVDGAATAAAPTKKRKAPVGVAEDPGPQDLSAAASAPTGDDPIAAARLKEKKEAQAVTKQLKQQLSERHRITTKQLQLKNMGWKAGVGTPAADTLMALLPLGHAASAHAAKKPDHTELLRQVLTHLDATKVEAAGAAQAEPAAVAAAAAASCGGAGGEGGEEGAVRGSSQR